MKASMEIIGGVLGWFIGLITAAIIMNDYYLDEFQVRSCMFIGISCGAFSGLWLAKKINNKVTSEDTKETITLISLVLAFIFFFGMIIMIPAMRC